LTLGVAAQATAYVKVPIPDEMSIQVPKNWIVIGDDFTTTIEAWAEALDEEDAPLLASALTVRSPLSQGYATLSIRIDRGKCPSQEDLKELPDATAVVLMEQNRVQMAKGFAQAGVAFTHWKTEKAVLSNGFQTIKNS